MPVSTEWEAWTDILLVIETWSYGPPMLALCFEMEAEMAIVGFLNSLLGFMMSSPPTLQYVATCLFSYNPSDPWCKYHALSGPM